MCLSVTKWIHLNFGDLGIKRLFKKVYNSLRVGGYFVLEPQDWKSYKKNYKILFVGNINYLPNKIACYNFAKTIMPKLKIKYSNLEFNIVGKINFIDKLILSPALGIYIGPS